MERATLFYRYLIYCATGLAITFFVFWLSVCGTKENKPMSGMKMADFAWIAL